MTEAGAVAEYIDWFNHRRLHGEIGLIPPAENEDNHYRHNTAPTTVGASVASLHHTRGETHGENDRVRCLLRQGSRECRRPASRRLHSR